LSDSLSKLEEVQRKSQ